MEYYGYVGKIARINLTEEKISFESLDLNMASKFIGASGFAIRFLIDEIDPAIDPFSPENKLIIMTGALTGTIVPGANKFAVAAKSPLTMGYGEAHAGGFWGVELKRAGYDGLIIEGRAEKPVYIYIKDNLIEIRNAVNLWGKSTSKTDKIIKDIHKDRGVRVFSIGIGGENLVRYACIVTEERIAGRTGMGAVMGSKNLKAIAVRGSGRIGIKNYDRVRMLVKRLYPAIMSYPPSQIRALYGTNGEMPIFYEYGDVPIKNFSLGKWDGIKKISGKAIVEKMLKRHRACFNCPVHCWKEVEVEIEGMGKIVTKSPEYETATSLGSNLLIDNPEAIVYMSYLCNEYGIDTISTGVTIAWAMEAFEKGALTEEDTGGIELRWGDYNTAIKLIEMIAYRKGFGNILAEGCRLASKLIDKGSEEYAMHVKGVEVPMHDPRAFKGLGLQYATSNRGADHLYGFFVRIEQGERMPDLKIYERVDRFKDEGKGWMVAVREDWDEIVDSMGLCKFVLIYPGHVAGFYSLVTGISKTVRDLLKDGERIFNLKRLFNIACGIGRKDDVLPKRFLKEAFSEGGAKGQVVNLDKMLREYYEYRDWDEDGKPSRRKIEELGIFDILSQRYRKLYL
ncbi:MAG: aldehyde ferredoxin oxidoreductase [Thermoprotei archaeon]|nr:MAG: aldehyde ferredoxin oxidoreductase [Thermoprotei archaeon]